MIIVELATVALLFLLGIAAAVVGIVWVFAGGTLRSLKARRTDVSTSSAAATAGEIVQGIMLEADGHARMALLLRAAGVSSMPHREGMLLTRGTDSPLSALLDGKRMPGVLGGGKGNAWPQRSLWVPDEAWNAMCAQGVGMGHPVAMLEAIRNAARPMPYEGGTLAAGMLAAGSQSLPLRLAQELHLPVNLLTSKEKAAVQTAFVENGAVVTEGDFATSLTLADLIDKAAARKRAADRSNGA